MSGDGSGIGPQLVAIFDHRPITLMFPDLADVGRRIMLAEDPPEMREYWEMCR